MLSITNLFRGPALQTAAPLDRNLSQFNKLRTEGRVATQLSRLETATKEIFELIEESIKSPSSLLSCAMKEKLPLNESCSLKCLVMKEDLVFLDIVDENSAIKVEFRWNGKNSSDILLLGAGTTRSRKEILQVLAVSENDKLTVTPTRLRHLHILDVRPDGIQVCKDRHLTQYKSELSEAEKFRNRIPSLRQEISDFVFNITGGRFGSKFIRELKVEMPGEKASDEHLFKGLLVMSDYLEVTAKSLRALTSQPLPE